MTPRNKKPFLLAIPLVLLAGGLAIAFMPDVEIPNINPDKSILQIETIESIDLAKGPVKVEAQSLKNEWFLNWELAEEREGITITKVDSLVYRVQVSATGHFEPVELSVYTVDSSVRHSVILTWDAVAESISLDVESIIF